MSEWSFYNPSRIIFGVDSISSLADLVQDQRVALITSPGFTRRGVTARVQEQFGPRLIHVIDTVKPNPDVEDIDSQAEGLKASAPDCLIALGGGSSMDTAKGLARLLGSAEGSSLSAHFRDGAPLNGKKALPVVAIPSTSGTGAEVTPFGTVWDFRLKKKYSVTGDDLFPVTAVLDPSLTLDLPEAVTISSGLDAVSHAMESIWNKKASPISLGLSTQSLMLSIDALTALKTNPRDLAARSKMMEASLLAGLAISQTRTALAHSISYPLTTAFDLPHGLACSFTLPALLRFNAGADDGRLQRMANTLGHESPLAVADSLSKLFRLLNVQGIFRSYVPSADKVLALKEKMYTPGRADNNMRSANLNDVETIVTCSTIEMFN